MCPQERYLVCPEITTMHIWKIGFEGDDWVYAKWFMGAMAT